MTTREQTKVKLRALLRRDKPRLANLGYPVNSILTVMPEGEPHLCLVSYRDGSWGKALHKDRIWQISLAIAQNDFEAIRNAPVVVMKDYQGRDYIEEFDPDQRAAFGLDETPAAGEIGKTPVPYINDNLIQVWHVSDMIFHISAGVYFDSILRWWVGGDINLADPDARPATASHHQWAVIGIDSTLSPVVLDFATSASQHINVPLDKNKIGSIDAGSMVMIAAIGVANGQTDGSSSEIVLLNSGYRRASASSFTLAGDSGSTPIADGDTLTITGGDAIDTSVAGDTLTIGVADGGITLPKLGILTTKGDLLAHDVDDHIRLPVGADYKALIADSSQTAGMGWDYPMFPRDLANEDLVVPTGYTLLVPPFAISGTGTITVSGTGRLRIV